MGDCGQSACWGVRVGERETVSSGVPVIAGDRWSFIAAGGNSRAGKWMLAEGERGVFGVVRSSGHDRAAESEAIYGELFRAMAGWHLYRVWNFVPAINGVVDGLENYRAFCLGRHTAFREFYGEASESVMPAASAVGTDGADFVAWFVGGKSVPRHFENPDQMPAYLYPERYGPRPPSFSRATVVGRDGGPARVYLSGTSSIRGHETVAKGDVLGQTEVTLRNLDRILAASAEGRPAEVESMTVYLRQAADHAGVEALLRKRWQHGTGRLTFLRADICRADLDVEIEAIANVR